MAEPAAILLVLCQGPVVPMALVAARATDKVVAAILGDPALGDYGRVKYGNKFTSPGT